MRYLFHYLENVERQIKDAGKMFILADYDGTLTPIVDKPDLAVLPEAMRRILQSIVEHSRYKLAIISGRDVETVKKLVNVCGAFYVGNHGFEIVGPNLHLVHPEAEKIRPVMTAVREELRMEIGHVEGLIIEDKRLTLSVHFRLAPKKYVASIKRKVKMVARKHREVTV
ncbi:MAG: trehalose-phosphatase, partial [Candidatus Bathyarchaeia archaeon]